MQILRCNTISQFYSVQELSKTKMISWVIILAVLQFLLDCKAQSCLRASNGDRPLPAFVRDGENFRANPIQAIITSYRFNCCGVITEWAAHVERSGSGGDRGNPPYNNGFYTIAFQVWRPNFPSPVETDGCYTMVGENLFRDIVLQDTDDIYERAVRESPAISERIEVQPGDVVGFYLTSVDTTENNGIRFADNDPDYTAESVWFATGDNIILGGSSTCPYPVGNGRTLSMSTNFAPLITVAVSMIDCPQTNSRTIMLTTSPPFPSPSGSPIPTTTITNAVETMVPDIPTTTDLPTTQQSVWFATGSNIYSGGSPAGPHPVGSGRTLSMSTNLAPLITVAMSTMDSPLTTSKTIILTTNTPFPSPSGSPIPITTITNAVVTMVPEIPTTTDLPTTQQAPGDAITGLAAGIISIIVFLIGIIAVLVIVILLMWRTKKKKPQQTQDNVVYYSTVKPATNATNQEPFYDAVDSSVKLTTSKNEAYGKINQAPQDEVNELLTIQNAAYATTTTRNDYPDYYVNEGMNNPPSPMIANKAYLGFEQLPPTSHVNNSQSDTSIPTTRNEAYTSVSTNTERGGTGYTYDYVRNL